MLNLIIMLFVCLALYAVWSCCKNNPNWVNRKKEDPKPICKSRIVLRVWNYETALVSPDPWLQPAE
jgi:hypothetical protein